ncbi:DapH/DapD/GlmU-related protein [Pectobacterium sp. CFBP8739]|uniref:DapH/DapD/GlmU-related protein n=1 Tax=Pectobacterium sp. CFBP8739 TaxID=2748908 RepID=UPI0015DDEE5D|nr:DapH/DapD/GlmU-related protein [Pectobacterium sp. CFBP8739]MBA0167782.1 acyltransferase [Pectobacterium sp. CFBP8739]
MHFIYKVIWIIRAFIYGVFLGRFGFPGYIGPPMFIQGWKRIFIGKRVRVFPGLRAECHGEGRLFIHDNVSIGQGFHVTCMGDLHIKKGVLITGYVTVTDIEHEYMSVDSPILEQPMILKKTEIGENSFIGMGARIQAGTILGKGCIVGANAVVRGVFPDYSVIVGAPGRVIKRYNPETSSWERVCEVEKHSQD